MQGATAAAASRRKLPGILWGVAAVQLSKQEWPSLTQPKCASLKIPARKMRPPMRRAMFLTLGLTVAAFLASCGGAAGGGQQQITVTINPISAVVTVNQSMPFTDKITGTTNTAVGWEVNSVVGARPRAAQSALWACTRRQHKCPALRR